MEAMVVSIAGPFQTMTHIDARPGKFWMLPHLTLNFTGNSENTNTMELHRSQVEEIHDVINHLQATVPALASGDMTQ